MPLKELLVIGCIMVIGAATEFAGRQLYFWWIVNAPGGQHIAYHIDNNGIIQMGVPPMDPSHPAYKLQSHPTFLDAPAINKPIPSNLPIFRTHGTK